MKKINWKFWSKNDEPIKHELYNAERDWFILLAISALVIIVLFLIYFYLNSLIRALPESRAPETTATSSTPQLTRADLQKYAEEIERRETQFETLLESPPKVSDPSI